MILSIATWVIIGWGVITACYMLGAALMKFPGRTADDVAEFLRPVDLEQAEILLDRGTYLELRWNLDAKTLQETQRKRMHRYLELVRRMAHNARVLVELGNQEADRHQDQDRRAEAIARLQEEAVKVRVYSLVTILKLRVLLAIRPMQAPSLTSLRMVYDLDGIAIYKALRQASTDLFEELRRPVDKLTLNF